MLRTMLLRRERNVFNVRVLRRACGYFFNEAIPHFSPMMIAHANIGKKPVGFSFLGIYVVSIKKIPCELLGLGSSVP